jgi:hypothetical protein
MSPAKGHGIQEVSGLISLIYTKIPEISRFQEFFILFQNNSGYI